jgi:hypothetical protein
MMLSSLVRRLRALARKGAMERELDEEFRHHLECQIEISMAAGMGAEEARRAALRDFGSVERVKEECRDTRGVRLIEDIWRDLRYGVVFYERGESRKNFSHAGGMKDSFDRQPPLFPSARQHSSGLLGFHIATCAGSQPCAAFCSRSSTRRRTRGADQCSI